MFNPLIKKSLIKNQIETEFKDREKKFGHKERDCTKAYFDVRKEMIIKYNSNFNDKLNEEEIEELTISIRGMIESDIQRYIENYRKIGRFFHRHSHPTNTCDPFTGNWCEHLMDPYYLKDILSKIGFEVEVFGYYGRPENIVKRYVFGKQGIRIAPFFTIYGIR